jgi:hypothetical protein
MLRAEDAALTQRIRSVVQATTGHTAPHTVNCRPGATHVRGRVRAAELLSVSQWRSVHVRRAAEHAAAFGVLGGRAPQPQWLVTLDTPRGYCRDFNIAVESGLVGGPQRALIFVIYILPTVCSPYYLRYPCVRMCCFIFVFVTSGSFMVFRAFGIRFLPSRRKF